MLHRVSAGSFLFGLVVYVVRVWFVQCWFCSVVVTGSFCFGVCLLLVVAVFRVRVFGVRVVHFLFRLGIAVVRARSVQLLVLFRC